mgnify:CR=1 FL=1
MKTRFTAEFNSHIIKLCHQPYAVIPQIAREHDLIPNMVNRCFREHRLRHTGSGFVPVQVVTA